MGEGKDVKLVTVRKPRKQRKGKQGREGKEVKEDKENIEKDGRAWERKKEAQETDDPRLRLAHSNYRVHQAISGGVE